MGSRAQKRLKLPDPPDIPPKKRKKANKTPPRKPRPPARKKTSRGSPASPTTRSSRGSPTTSRRRSGRRRKRSPPTPVPLAEPTGSSAYQALAEQTHKQIPTPSFVKCPVLIDPDEWDDESDGCIEDLSDRAFLMRNFKEEMRQKLYYSQMQDHRKKELEHEKDSSVIVPPRPTGTNMVMLSKTVNDMELVLPEGLGHFPTFNYTPPENPQDWRNPPHLIRVLSYGTGAKTTREFASYGGKGARKKATGKGKGAFNNAQAKSTPEPAQATPKPGTLFPPLRIPPRPTSPNSRVNERPAQPAPGRPALRANQPRPTHPPGWDPIKKVHSPPSLPLQVTSAPPPKKLRLRLRIKKTPSADAPQKPNPKPPAVKT